MQPCPGFRLEQGNGGLRRATIETEVCQGELYLHGAHVTHYQPRGQAPVLWLSNASYFASGKPIRGGIPICFPWFGPHPSNSMAPAHGTARLGEWELKSTLQLSDGGIGVELAQTIQDFHVRYRVDFGAALELTLSVELPVQATGARQYEEALHTYLAVSKIHDISIAGLESANYIDKMADGLEQPAGGTPIRFDSETDRVYLQSPGPCQLHDPGLNRTIFIDKGGSQATVVWNPWIAKSVRMPDFGDHEWPDMVCIESANVGPHAIVLQPGDIHTLRTRIEVVSPMVG